MKPSQVLRKRGGIGAAVLIYANGARKKKTRQTGACRDNDLVLSAFCDRPEGSGGTGSKLERRAPWLRNLDIGETTATLTSLNKGDA